EVGNGKNEQEAITTTPIQEHLVKRIAELTELFLQTKKRQGGDRAQNNATIWATILARRELGESLTDIAIDLDLPYETAKGYVKRDRKTLDNIKSVP
ncbi:MAG: CRISPR-associated endoribonuclease Cas6, partial [Pseudanabaena sp.]